MTASHGEPPGAAGQRPAGAPDPELDDDDDWIPFKSIKHVRGRPPRRPGSDQPGSDQPDTGRPGG